MLAAAALVLGMGAAHADDSKTLYFYNWTEYVPPGLLEQFTKETGIKVIYSTYESNETMYAKLKTYKDGAYDLVVPSTYFVDKMRKEGMIQKIDKTKLTHFNNLDPEMLNKPFDPNNDYSIPYMGATAIGVNSEAIDPKTVTSWADLWKPEYKGSLLLTDDAREVFQVALRNRLLRQYDGSKEIEAAYNELKKLMPNVAASTLITRQTRIWKAK
jgi:spermidine/putrescine transport system substrate-binding protein